MSPSCHKSWSTKYHFSADAQVAIAASKVITSAFTWQLTIWLSSSNVNTHCACFTKNGVKKNCGLPHENLQKKKAWKVRVLKNGEMKWKTRDFEVGENKEKKFKENGIISRGSHPSYHLPTSQKKKKKKRPAFWRAHRTPPKVTTSGSNFFTNRFAWSKFEAIFQDLSETEKTRGPLLSIESWLVNKDPYNGLL